MTIKFPRIIRIKGLKGIILQAERQRLLVPQSRSHKDEWDFHRAVLESIPPKEER